MSLFEQIACFENYQYIICKYYIYVNICRLYIGFLNRKLAQFNKQIVVAFDAGFSSFFCMCVAVVAAI